MAFLGITWLSSREVEPVSRLLLALSIALPLCFSFISPALAAETGHGVDGKELGLIWIVPFVGMLLSIALMPLLVPDFWHHHYGKVSLFWGLAFLVPFAVLYGISTSADQLLHTVFLEYIPFIVLIGALFTIAGGIYVGGNLRGSPLTNTVLLGVGTALASFVGTTGASMVLIRPLLRANDDRKHCAHTVIFFIFLVSNIGGSLTPLGDPPLFLGFLKGVDFFWPMTALFLPMITLAGLLLVIFYALDSVIYAREGHLPRDPTPDAPVNVTGLINLVLLAGLLVAVLMSGTIDLGAVALGSFEIPVAGLLREAILIILALTSLLLTPGATRDANRFSWEPVVEVAKLFGAIFVTIIPAIAILRAGTEGAMAPLLQMVTLEDGAPNNAMYFWLTGGLSSFLDNAPTYLIFFNLAGGDPAALQGPLGTTLMAISAGAVFMGANTYIGNAPNFMVKSIAERQGIRMPSFFGYMAWSAAFLLPLFALITYLFFA
jgi:Na+/H+ antiporter NhaD/arsenite permease-like protein